MEILCIGLVVLAILGAIFGDKEEGGTATSAGGIQPFQARAFTRNDSHDGQKIRVIVVEMRGSMVGPHDNWTTRILVGMVDKTEGEDKPVLCFVPGMTMKDSGIFLMEGPVQHIPYQFASIDRWVELCRIPIDALLFPSRGRRRVELTVQVGEPLVITGDTTSLTVDFEGRGYEEVVANQRRIDQLTVQLAMSVCAADGSLGDDEAEVVREFVRGRIDAAPEDVADSVKEELNEAVRTGADALEQGRVPDLCRELVELTDPAQRYAVIDLAFKVAGVDQQADPGELRVLESVARGLDLDMERFRTMREKELPIQFHDEQSPEVLLGIHDGMSESEVRKKLSREFRKWNARATHQDPKVREQAQRMIDLISETREARLG